MIVGPHEFNLTQKEEDMAKYMKVLQETLNQPAIKNCGMTTAQINEAIGDITEQLRGPLSNQERLLLCAERSELRATLKVEASR